MEQNKNYNQVNQNVDSELEPFVDFKAITINNKTFPLKLIYAIAEVQKAIKFDPGILENVKNNFAEIWKDLENIENGELVRDIEKTAKDLGIDIEVAFLAYNMLFQLDSKKNILVEKNKFNEENEILMDILDLSCNVETLVYPNPSNRIVIVKPIEEEKELDPNYNHTPVNMVKTFVVY